MSRDDSLIIPAILEYGNELVRITYLRRQSLLSLEMIDALPFFRIF